MARLFQETDRKIFAFALPALGALAAEPLYVLVDTAIVGHLGSEPLAALALAGTVLIFITALCNFLAYGTTTYVGQLLGEGERKAAATVTAQALILALTLGLTAVLLVNLTAPLLIAVLGGSGEVASQAVIYLRVVSFGLPAVFIALVGQGYLRGCLRVRESLYILVAANLLNVALDLLFVYGFNWGLMGSAIGTLISQLLMGAAFLPYLLPNLKLRLDRAWMLRVISSGSDLLLRSAALLFAFAVAGAVLARVSTVALGAHQIATQILIFLALSLDALALAGQALIARALGEGSGVTARRIAWRVMLWSLVVGLLLLLLLLPLARPIGRIFTGDSATITQLELLWPLFILGLPVAALAFALDGILAGAGQTRYIRNAMLFAALIVFVPISLATLHFGWGVRGVWAGMLALMLARTLTMGAHFVRMKPAAVTGR